MKQPDSWEDYRLDDVPDKALDCTLESVFKEKNLESIESKIGIIFDSIENEYSEKFESEIKADVENSLGQLKDYFCEPKWLRMEDIEGYVRKFLNCREVHCKLLGSEIKRVEVQFDFLREVIFSSLLAEWIVLKREQLALL